ncbi:hypothetical protein TI39_contig426g00010 [Zymoseptoria brevis]|uniref:RING-type domain-containing protein n=1 Tax=Zymoseptoria brevis TaxID=1047168 RepID=A0A0F4GPT8_9PEZI|nr:hypothetical protein TI39_contig426g00010 [Zymoseptoria brevis]
MSPPPPGAIEANAPPIQDDRLNDTALAAQDNTLNETDNSAHVNGTNETNAAVEEEQLSEMNTAVRDDEVEEMGTTVESDSAPRQDQLSPAQPARTLPHNIDPQYVQEMGPDYERAFRMHEQREEGRSARLGDRIARQDEDNTETNVAGQDDEVNGNGTAVQHGTRDANNTPVPADATGDSDRPSDDERIVAVGAGNGRLILIDRFWASDEQNTPAPDFNWEPFPVEIPSIEESANGLTPLQLAAFLHWQLHQESIWAHNVGGIQDDDDNFYNPFTDDHPIQSWISFSAAMELYLRGLPLYNEIATEEQVCASMPRRTIHPEEAPQHPTADEAENTAISSLHKRIVQELKDDCKICGEAVPEDKMWYLTKCGHVGCQRCVIKWLKANRTCPWCRRDVDHKDSILVELAVAAPKPEGGAVKRKADEVNLDADDRNTKKAAL